MFCRYCGNEVDENSIFCTECGKKLAVDKAAVEEQEETVQRSEGKYRGRSLDGSEIVKGQCRDPLYLIGALLFCVGVVVSLVWQIKNTMEVFSALSERFEEENTTLSEVIDALLKAKGAVAGILWTIVIWLIVMWLCMFAVTIAQITLAVVLFQAYLDAGRPYKGVLRNDFFKMRRALRTIGVGNVIAVLATIGWLIIWFFVLLDAAGASFDDLELGRLLIVGLILLLISAGAVFYCRTMVYCGARMDVYRRIEESGLRFYYEDVRPALYCWISGIMLIVAIIYLKISLEGDGLFSEMVDSIENSSAFTVMCVSGFFRALAVLMMGVKHAMLERELGNAAYLETEEKKH